MTTPSVLERWPALRDLSDGLSPGRWAATFFAVALGQFVFWVALLHLLIGERERVERLMYFTGFTLLPLASAFITFGGAWLAQRRGADLTAFSDSLIAFNLSLALVAGLLARGDFLPSSTLQPLHSQWLQFLTDNPQFNFISLSEVIAASNFPSVGYDFSALGIATALTAWFVILWVNPSQKFDRLTQFIVSISLLMIVLLGGLLDGRAQDQLVSIRLEPSGQAPLWFTWQRDGNCIRYQFSTPGAQAVWLGKDGLASVDPINDGLFCDEALPRVLRITDGLGTEHQFLVGRFAYASWEAWWLGLAFDLVGPALILWGGLRGAGLLTLLGLGTLFAWAFLPAGLNAWPMLLSAGIGAILASLPWRGGRWFDWAFGLLIAGLVVNLGFVYDQFHYHSGWMATINAMLHGQTLMVDVFSQRGFLSMVTLAGVFSLLPLSYPMFSLLISGLIAAQLIAIYVLLKWVGVGRWWATLAVLGGISIHIYLNRMVVIGQPGFSPLRLGHVFLLALVLVWRLRSERRAAQWLEWGLLVFSVLWGIDTAVMVLASYGALLAYEAFHRHGVSVAGLVWLMKRVALLTTLIGGAFLASSLWLWLSTGQVPRWDIYWGFFAYHENHPNYQTPILFWEPWWLNIVPQFAALMMLVWRAFSGQSAASWRREAIVMLIAAGGVVQFYHYTSQSLFVNSHSLPSMVALAYLLYCLGSSALSTNRHFLRWVALSVVLTLGYLGATQKDEALKLNPPALLALAYLGEDILQGESETLDHIARRWTEFQDGYSIRSTINPFKSWFEPSVNDVLSFIRRYSPNEERLNVFMGPNNTVHTLLIVGAAHRYPITITVHDTRVPDLVEQILATDVVQQVGDMLYLKPDDEKQRGESQPLMPILLDRLCRQFDFELLETSEHGVMAIRLQPSRGENAVCETYGLYLEQSS